MQMRRLFFLPRNTLNRYYFSSSTTPNDIGVTRPSSQTTNDVLHLSQSQEKQSGSKDQLYGESSKLQHISDVAQKAIWASAIINHVIESSPTKSIQKSLRDEILELEIPAAQKKINLDHTYQQQIKSYFKSGVRISRIVYNQERVLSAHHNKAHRFFPTNSVSKMVFSKMRYSEPNIFIGSFGIGKTFSIIMFIELVKHVNRLKYLAYGTWVDQSTAERYKKQLKMLENQNLIGDFPKYLYWSIKSGLRQNEKVVKRLILYQIEQLCLPDTLKNKLSQCDKLEDLIFLLNQLLPEESGLPDKMIVIDQINVVTSAMRNWNTQATKFQSENKPLTLASQNIVKNCLVPASKILPLIHQFQSLGTSYILNSSFNLEKQLIGKIDDQDQLSLKFIDHGTIKPIEIQYAKELVDQKVKIEFLQFFLFVLEQKCMNKPQTLKKFQLIKKNLKFDLINVKNYYRQLYVGQFFKQKFSTLEIQLLSEEKISDFFSQLSKQFNKYCLKQSQARLKTFINKGEDEGVKRYKLMVIKTMQVVAIQCLVNGIDKLRFSASRLQKIAKQHTLAKNYANLKTYLATKDHNSELLPCTYIQQDKSVEFDWTPRDFLEIATPILFPQIIDSNQFLFERPIRDLVRDKVKRVTGSFMQYFIKILFSQFPTIQVKSLTLSQYKQYQQILTFNIYGIQTFLIFNEQSETNKKESWIFQKNSKNQTIKIRQVRLIGSLKRNLSNLLQMSKKDPTKHYFGIPVSMKSQYHIQQNANESQGIDMIFVKYNQKYQIFEITTMDATIQKKNLSQKIQKAENLLKNMLKKVPKYANRPQLNTPGSNSRQKDTETTQQIQDPGDDTNQYTINHVLICPAKSCGRPKVISKDLLTISYFPIEDIRLPGNENSDIYKSFQIWRKITLQKDSKQ